MDLPADPLADRVVVEVCLVELLNLFFSRISLQVTRWVFFVHERRPLDCFHLSIGRQFIDVVFKNKARLHVIVRFVKSV